MEKKLKFRSVVSLVIGSQIGSGVFLLPASMAALGPVSLLGWGVSGVGAILLALVFAQLSMRVAKGGGPHVYVERAFGPRWAFYTAWTYWLISWVSSIAVIVAAIGYLSPLIGVREPMVVLALEVGLICGVTLLNMRGAGIAGGLEVFLTVMKCLPLVVIPVAALFCLKREYFTFGGGEVLGPLNAATLMTFWGFVGLETATTSAGVIENPTKVVPRAVVLGTVVVGLIYFLNSFGVMGVVPPEVLMKSQAPYVDATRVLFGGGWDVAIAGVAFVACVGTLNAWVLTSGQIALEASRDGLFPRLFGRVNGAGAPYMGLMIALGCTVPILIMTLTPNILTQLNLIIDLSVTAFVLIYLMCGLAYLKMGGQKGWHRAVGVGACLFCGWVLIFGSVWNIVMCALFVLSGVPVYFRQKKRVEAL